MMLAAETVSMMPRARGLVTSTERPIEVVLVWRLDGSPLRAEWGAEKRDAARTELE
jgi:hypothetical protein